ncbi:hypothetical protein CDIK_0244 [Cucumispora dikerogammari]|nr:hypothetical protein CDIK_0244 [Cucumispora dikerogammari]
MLLFCSNNFFNWCHDTVTENNKNALSYIYIIEPETLKNKYNCVCMRIKEQEEKKDEQEDSKEEQKKRKMYKKKKEKKRGIACKIGKEKIFHFFYFSKFIWILSCILSLLLLSKI